MGLCLITGIFPAVVEGPERGSSEYSQAASQLGSTRVNVYNIIYPFNVMQQTGFALGFI